ncbi:MAG: dynamin family protein [Chloroflexi bacterium]|nr:dynamin family protein [Chloroflexota bacterium]
MLAAERDLLAELRETLAALGAGERDLAPVRQAAADLEDLVLVVVVGEFNAGKSALLNALLAGPYVEEGVTPTTVQVTILRYGEEPRERHLPGGVVEWALSAPLLRELSIVDTPGTNAVLRRHEELTREFIPRSDLVLFVTSVDRPFTESERAFMEEIRGWGKKMLIALNKIDLLRDEAQVAEVQTLADVTGLLAAGVLAGLGFFIIPLRRRQAREQFRARTDGLRMRLKDGMLRQFEPELERSIQRIRQVLAPYTRRIGAEHERLQGACERLTGLQTRLGELRARVERELLRG